VNFSALPSMRTSLLPASGCGCAFRLASKAGPFRAVVLRTGIFSVNSPSSGTHSLRQTSQSALSLTSSSPASSEGLNSGLMVSGTGSSTVSS
jgi:hypothetical protein